MDTKPIMLFCDVDHNVQECDFKELTKLCLCRQSRKQIHVKCASQQCLKNVFQEYRLVLDIISRYGLYYCTECVNKIHIDKITTIPVEHNKINNDYFSIIDTEEKAYLLGAFICSLTMNNVNDKCQISLYNTDIVDNFIYLLGNISIDLNFTSHIHHIAILSQDAVSNIYNLIYNTEHEKCIPTCLSEEFKWAFVRGIFDECGIINRATGDNIRSCKIIIQSQNLRNDIMNVVKIKCQQIGIGLYFNGVNAIDFLSKIYDNADTKLRSSNNYNMYLQYLGYVSENHDNCVFNIKWHIPQCKYVKTDSRAIAPSKNNASDEGYDLTLISVDKVISENTIRYDTGIKIQPEEGWHIELLPRSSLSNSGYILANSIGLIDSSYRASLKVVLTKVNKDANDIKLPFRGVQFVLRKSIHFICAEEDELDDTTRGLGGFGSTGV